MVSPLTEQKCPIPSIRLRASFGCVRHDVVATGKAEKEFVRFVETSDQYSLATSFSRERSATGEAVPSNYLSLVHYQIFALQGAFVVGGTLHRAKKTVGSRKSGFCRRPLAGIIVVFMVIFFIFFIGKEIAGIDIPCNGLRIRGFGLLQMRRKTRYQLHSWSPQWEPRATFGAPQSGVAVTQRRTFRTLHVPLFDTLMREVPPIALPAPIPI